MVMEGSTQAPHFIHSILFLHFQFGTGYFQMMDLSVFTLKLKAVTAWNLTGSYESSIANLLPLDMKFNKISAIALYQWGLTWIPPHF